MLAPSTTRTKTSLFVHEPLSLSKARGEDFNVCMYCALDNECIQNLLMIPILNHEQGTKLKYKKLL